MDKTKTSTKEKSDRYIEAIGRRKTSTARVRLTPASKNSFVINDKNLDTYFPTEEMRGLAVKPLSTEGVGKFAITVVLKGGGIHSQAEAVSHGIARALVKDELTLRKDLKKAGMLKRDPRAKERRKPGLKKARKRPKWSKR
jgi:small subunit ribosomal protein S9